MRWRRDDRQQPDDRLDLPAEEWLSEFRPVRPDALTSADRDATRRPAHPLEQPGSDPGARARASGQAESGGREAGRPVPRSQPDSGPDGRPGPVDGRDQPARRPASSPSPTRDHEPRGAGRSSYRAEVDRRDDDRRDDDRRGVDRRDGDRRGVQAPDGGRGDPAGRDGGAGEFAAGRDNRRAQRPADDGGRYYRNGAGTRDYLAGRVQAEDSNEQAGNGRRDGFEPDGDLQRRRGESDPQGFGRRDVSGGQAPDRDPRGAAREGYRDGYDRRNGGSGLAPDRDPRGSARESYRNGGSGLAPDRDPRGSAREGYRNGGSGLASDRDPRGSAREGYRNGYDRPNGGSGLAPGPNPRRPADDRYQGRNEYRPDRAGPEPGRDGYRLDRPGVEPPPGERQSPYRPQDSKYRADSAIDGDIRSDPLAGRSGSGQENRAARSGLPHTRADEPPPPGPGPRLQGRGRDEAPRPGTGPVPYDRDVSGQASFPSDDRDDDILTRPLPVILPGATTLPRPAPIAAPRGPFEPARPSQPPRSASITGSVEPPPATFAAPAPAPAAPPVRPIPEAAAAKLDQIKDLYLTAEAIGEDALDKHFDQVSQRQRELIREFFERSGPSDGSSQA